MIFLSHLDQGQPYSSWLDFPNQPCTGSPDELVRQDEDQDVSFCSSICYVRDGNDVLGESSAREVLDVLMVSVDDLGQLTTIDLVLKDPHADILLKSVRKPLCIGPH